MSLTAILQHSDLFQGLNESQLAQIMNISQERKYNQGDVVFAQDSEGDAMYVIAKGQVEIQIKSESGKKRSAVYLGEGQVFGELALIDQGKRSASIVVIEDGTIIYRILSEALNQLCATDTAIGYLMMRNLAKDVSFKLRHQNRLVADL